MTRRLLIASLFVGFALSSTGCCGVIRNFVYRVRHNHGCYPAYGAPCGDAGPGYSPSYSIGAPAMPEPGCAGCGASAMPMGAPYGMSAPTAPGMAYAVPTVPPTGTPSVFPGMGAKVAGTR